jgi:hypothetical protein
MLRVEHPTRKKVYRTNATLGQKIIILRTAQIFEITLKNLPNLSNGCKFKKSDIYRFKVVKFNRKANISILPKFSNGSEFKLPPAQPRTRTKLNIGQNSAQASRWYGYI